MVPDIIPLTEDNDFRPPAGAPVYDDKSGVDSLLVHPPTELEVDFVSDDADDSTSNYPYPASKIPSLSQPSPPNNSQEGGISQEGAQAENKRKYQRKQWSEAIWGRGKNGKIKCVELNKFNRQIYA